MLVYNIFGFIYTYIYDYVVDLGNSTQFSNDCSSYFTDSQNNVISVVQRDVMLYIFTGLITCTTTKISVAVLTA